MSGVAASDRCPRCGALFHCGAHDASPCACASLTLDPALLDALRARYVGCLCLRCLQALSAGAPPAAVSGVATPPSSA